MIEARFVPIDVWPGDKKLTHQRRRSPFKGSWQNTLKTLERELEHLKAKDILVQAYLRREDIRLDGWPRSGASPSGPGVIVSFGCPTGALSFPCDTYLHWQDNLRAIALALESLRAVERYGVTRQNEQYKGWAQLPPAPKTMAANDAVTFFCLHSGVSRISQDNFSTAFRSAAMRLHPDNQDTGNEHLFRLLGQAKKALQDAYGWA